MPSITRLSDSIQRLLGLQVQSLVQANNELTLEVDRENIVEICTELRDHEETKFEQLCDLCGVDYSQYGLEDPARAWQGPRYAVVYHLLSVSLNHRLRLKTFLDDEFPAIQSVIQVWPNSDWFEREAFDLFGIIFESHPDLRRILTDYGFIGHPFRKDFPLSGYVEMRYDADKGRVVYEPVTIEPRTLVPRIIREDSFGDRNP